MQYLLLIHNNARQTATEEQWQFFFNEAKQSGVFAGGSEVRTGELLGKPATELLSSRLAGYMRFEAADIAAIHQLLRLHPVVLNGGTVELCATPES